MFEFTSKELFKYAWVSLFSGAGFFFAAIWIWEQKFFLTGVICILLTAVFSVAGAAHKADKK